MSMRSSGGFTIIELSLFVAISAVIMISLMVGWSVAVNTQSYKDSARTLAQVLQQQYSDTINVSNDRANQISCRLDASTVRIEDNGSGAVPIGASRCVVMGRYVIINGTNLSMSDIVGYQPSSTAFTTDLQAIQGYYPTKEDSTVIPDETYEVAWSTRPYIATPANTAKVALVIVRSPLTGTVYTYTKQLTNNMQPSVTDVITTGTMAGVKLCLDPGAPVAQGKMAVQIAANAVSMAGVAVLGDAGAGC